MIKLNSIVSTIASDLYSRGLFAGNTPSVEELHAKIDSTVTVYQRNGLMSKKVNGNGINKQAELLYKILVNAK